MVGRGGRDRWIFNRVKGGMVWCCRVAIAPAPFPTERASRPRCYFRSWGLAIYAGRFPFRAREERFQGVECSTRATGRRGGALERVDEELQQL
eukprot:scaffold25872_cov51-Isochrysis_galbana.AAC.1